MQDNKYCVYLHKRKDNCEIIYVGEGRVSRANLLKLDKGKNKRHQEIVKTVGIICEIYRNGLTKQEAEKLESELILTLRNQGCDLTNVNKKATSAKLYKHEDFENLFYVDGSSPSGLRWKEDRYNIPNGYLLAAKDSVACCKKKTTGYWYYNNKASHRIVYALVHGECPCNLTIDHIDCNKDNNSIENLRLLSRSENSSRGNIYKVMPSGEHSASSKITNKQVFEIYTMFEEYKTNLEVAQKFNLHERYVSLIRHGKRWVKQYKEYGKVFPESFTENSNTYLQISEALKLLDSGLTNKDVSSATGMEFSAVSRLRHGKLFKTMIRKYREENMKHYEGLDGISKDYIGDYV